MLFYTPRVSPLKGVFMNPQSNVITNLLPAGSEDFQTGWTAYSEASVTVTQPVNMLAANQSNANTDTSGFSSNGSATITYSTDTNYESPGSIKVVCPGSKPWEGVGLNCYGLPANTVVTFSCYLYGNANLRLDRGGCFTGTANLITITTTWTRYSVTLNTGAGGYGTLLICGGSTPAANTFYVDLCQMEKGSSATAWTLGGCADPFGGYNAYRITTTGGTNNKVYYSPAVVATGKSVSSQLWVKNISTKTVFVYDTANGSVSVYQADGWKNCQAPNKLYGVTNPIRFGSASAGYALDFVVFGPPMAIISQFCYPDIWVPPGQEVIV